MKRRQPVAGPLPPLTPAQEELRGRLRGHVEKLATDIGERNVFQPAALQRAAAYVEAQLAAQGDRVEAQPFVSQGLEVRNLVVERRGASRPGEIVVAGAHYDSVIGAPGANDNGSGVAALLEIARAAARPFAAAHAAAGGLRERGAARSSRPARWAACSTRGGARRAART